MKRLQQGFTIVELVTVMIVVGILAAIAIPRMSRTGEFSASAYRNEVASALRHAQKSAVSHRRVVCASIATGSVSLQIAVNVGSSNCTRDYTSPDGSNYSSRDKDAKALGAFVGQTLLFMPNGEIRSNAGGNPIAAGVISFDGQPDIRIDGVTGYVQ